MGVYGVVYTGYTGVHAGLREDEHGRGPKALPSIIGSPYSLQAHARVLTAYGARVGRFVKLSGIP